MLVTTKCYNQVRELIHFICKSRNLLSRLHQDIRWKTKMNVLIDWATDDNRVIEIHICTGSTTYAIMYIFHFPIIYISSLDYVTAYKPHFNVTNQCYYSNQFEFLNFLMKKSVNEGDWNWKQISIWHVQMAIT